MSRRQLTADQQQWLHDELANWRSAGIVSEEQAASILGQYESLGDAQQRKRSLFGFVISGIAAFLVGLAVLLLIGYNWNEMPRGLKLAVIFGVILVTDGSGWLLRFKYNSRRGSELLFFLGCLFYGAGIWLVAQVFHLDSHYPDGIWWWVIGVIPFALALDSLLPHVLLVGLLALWAWLEIIDFSHLGAMLFWGRWTLPNGAYSLPLLAAPCLVWAYRKGSPTAVGLYALLGGWWAILQVVAWDLDWHTIYFVGSLGAMYLVIAESHRPGSKLAVPYRTWGTLLVAGVLIPLSFLEFNKEIERSIHGGWRASAAVPIVELTSMILFVAATILLCAWFQSGPEAGRKSLGERLMLLLRRQWLPVSLAASMACMLFWTSAIGENAEMAIGPTIVANVAMIGLSLWLIRTGLHEDRGRPFAFGVTYFLLWAVLRYIDLFGAMGGMLGASGMFFGCGAVLFIVGRFWHHRKEVRHV